MVKAFNTTGFNVMAAPVIGGVATVMFICGDDASAKKTILSLAAELGFDSIDAGPLTNARLLEPWAMLWIWLRLTGVRGAIMALPG